MHDAVAAAALSVPLAALLSRDHLALRLTVAPDAPGLVIHGAHASEMSDPYPYLLGGELLLTAGLHIPEAAGRGESDGGLPCPSEADGLADYCDDYVSRIVAAGGAALGFGLAPVHDTVPRALVTACERHGLPLLEVPPQTTFAAVASAVWQLMAQARLEELRRVSQAQQSLAAAASSADPVLSVLRRLAARLGGWAVLYGPQGAEIMSAGREPPQGSRAALSDLACFLTGHTSTTATDTVAGVHLSAYALGAREDDLVLGFASEHRESGDQTIASVGAVLLALLTGDRHSGTGAARSSALVRLLLGAGPEEVAPLLGGEEWVVVHARPDSGAVDPAAAGALGAALGSTLVDAAGYVGGGTGGAGDVVRILLPAGHETSRQPGWTLGVSAPVAPRHWPAADAQAARALTRALGTRTALVRHTASDVLAGLVADAGTEAHAHALLAPVQAVPALAGTLRTWLSLHGSWDRTAVALSVHRNTVRQRITRCADLLNADLDDPDIRMGLWFALRRASADGGPAPS
ncbi:helix-turn-helix domain-containing protein [Streptomyces sp. NPDC006475]|uniref:helix-turn-helix domain-containing protein n=1 Tax=Streptomyces sp. NPDC006475 TaxID=3155719 RepID=UPI0033A0ED75